MKILQRGLPQDDRAEMSFIDHLDVLRGHLLRSVIAIAIGATLIGIYNKFVVRQILMGPTHADFPTYVLMCKIGNKLGLGAALCIREVNVPMQNTVVSGQLSMFFSVIIIGGLILAFPYVFYEFWRFVRPALTKKELGKTRGVIFWVSFLFFTGVLFGYFVISPYTINFFSTFQIDENIENKWTISSYIDTMIPLVIGSGLAFQLPLVMYFLAKVGVVSGTFLRNVRKYAIVIIFIVAGIITPGPDIISQLTVAVPLIVLYEISILLARRIEKEQQKAELKEWS
ncbi:twin-arginine translocase subunit TatC [Paraflavisolibacter sp. H34]|uniref:twin-arginine translocase subunit TatC n=1 Tax=Huijunlia imazamoxiresistens TaxID=3127457 RepID=UPI00301A710A